MANLAAIIPAPKAPLEVHKVDTYEPGPQEILVRNEVIAFNPVEAKIARLGVIPIEYPAILGSSFAGTIEAIGSRVTDYHVGEKVAVSKRFGVVGNQYGAYQRYVVVKDLMISRVPADVAPAAPASIMMNATCVAGLFSGRLGLQKPSLDGSKAPSKEAKILVYGGSTSFGGLSIQYLAQAGYAVFTTSSPRNRDFVSKLGAAKVFDHTIAPDVLTEELVAAGPYDVVVDMISQGGTIATTASVLAAQGGGKLYAMEPAFKTETLPDGVTRVFEPWSDPLYEEENDGLRAWVLQTYIPHGLSQGYVNPIPTELVAGGLKSVDAALDRLQTGVSGVRLVTHPWDESE